MKISRMFAALCALLLLLCCVSCAARRTPTPEEFTAAAEAAGYTLDDHSGTVNVASTILSHSEYTANVAYYVYNTPALAQSTYAALLDDVPETSGTPQRVDSAEYNRYYIQSDDILAFFWRNGSTLIVLTGSDVKTLSTMLDALGI